VRLRGLEIESLVEVHTHAEPSFFDLAEFGYHSGESTLKTIELLGREVLPELEKYTSVEVGSNLSQFID
jgi:hypothetical protein